MFENLAVNAQISSVVIKDLVLKKASLVNGFFNSYVHFFSPLFNHKIINNKECCMFKILIASNILSGPKASEFAVYSGSSKDTAT